MLTIFLGHSDFSTVFAYSVSNIYDSLNGPFPFPSTNCPFLYSKSPCLSNQEKTTLPVILGLCSPIAEKETRLTPPKHTLGKWLQKENEYTQLHSLICIVVDELPSPRKLVTQPLWGTDTLAKNPCVYSLQKKVRCQPMFRPPGELHHP